MTDGLPKRGAPPAQRIGDGAELSFAAEQGAVDPRFQRAEAAGSRLAAKRVSLRSTAARLGALSMLNACARGVHSTSIAIPAEEIAGGHNENSTLC